MFGGISYAGSHENTPSKTPTTKVYSAPRTGGTTASGRPQQGSPTPRPGSKGIRSPSPSPMLSQRYTNRAYNRQPSPPERIQKPVGLTPHTERLKDKLLPSVPRVQPIPVCKRRSDIIKRSLEVQCSTQPPRPHTGYHRDEQRVKESPSFEDKVLMAVGEVLNHAVLEKGRIGMNDFDQILKDVRHRLKTNASVEEFDIKDNILVDVRSSKTSIRQNDKMKSSYGRLPSGKTNILPMIIRKDAIEASNKLQSAYRKTKILTNSSSQGNIMNSKLDNNVEGIFYNMPDSNSEQSNSNMPHAEEELSNTEYDKLEDRPDDFTTSKRLISELSYTEELENCQWNPTEDPKLQEYITNLVCSMNSEMKRTAIDEDGDGKHKVCRTVLVCKVCESDHCSMQMASQISPPGNNCRISKPTSKRVVLAPPSLSEVKDVGRADPRIRSSIRKSGTPVQNKTTMTKNTLINGKEEPHCEILKHNQNFQPDSRVEIMSSRNHQDVGEVRVPKTESKMSYTVTSSIQGDEEANDDMYLRRRRVGVVGPPLSGRRKQSPRRRV